MYRSFLALTALAATLPASIVVGQSTSPRLSPDVSVSHRYSPPEAIHRHSSTAYEGAMRGQAVWMSALGDLMLNESQAAYVWEHVESMHYDNKLKKTSTALLKKRMLAEYREYERQLRRDRIEAAKQLWQEKYLDLAHTYRLNEFQFNWETGAIYWPTLAATPRYARHRQHVAVLINQAVRYGAATDAAHRYQIARACDSFRRQLRKDAQEDHPSASDEYLAMQRFLVGLKYTPYLLDMQPPFEGLALK